MRLSLFDCADCETHLAMPSEQADAAEELNCPVCGDGLLEDADEAEEDED
jgi:hypothetical protein